MNPFQNLVRKQYEKLIFEFDQLSKDLFVDSSGKRFHNEEFGKYRENVVREFLRPFIPNNFGIGEGFVITPNGDISTQCDIIIYDRINTLLIENENKQRFFPIETVCAVGEVKSTLQSMSTFKEALNKLSVVKSLRSNYVWQPAQPFIKRINYIKVGGTNYDPKRCYWDNIVTFLVCDEIKGCDLTNPGFFNQLYDKITPLYDRHNMVLSLKNGLMLYRNHQTNKSFARPSAPNGEFLKGRLVKPIPDETVHVELFGQNIYWALAETTIMHIDIGRYLSRPTRCKYIDE